MKNDKLNLNWFDKIRILLYCPSSKAVKRFLDKGENYLTKEMDLKNLILHHRKIHNHRVEIIDLDKSEDGSDSTIDLHQDKQEIKVFGEKDSFQNSERQFISKKSYKPKSELMSFGE